MNSLNCSAAFVLWIAAFAGDAYFGLPRMTMNSLSTFCISGCWYHRSYAACLPFEKAFSEILGAIRGWDMHSKKSNSLKYFWQRNARLRADHPIPRKSQEGKEGAALHVRCVVAWAPASLGLYRSEMPALEWPSAIVLPPLPSGADVPTRVTHHHPPSQRAPWGLSTNAVHLSTATLVSGDKGNLWLWSRTHCGTSVLGVEEIKEKKEEWLLLEIWENPKITSTILNVDNLKLWHCYTFSNIFFFSFERMYYTRTN